MYKVQKGIVMVKVGTYVFGSNIPFEERLTVLKNTGFDFVALGLELFADNELENDVKLCEKYGFQIDNIHLTGVNTTDMWGEDSFGDEICDRYCREIKRASDAGIHVGVAHITWGHAIPAPINETGLSRFVRIAECAAEHGFVLGLENSVYPEYLYATMERLKDYKSIGFTFDTGHRNAFAPDHDFLKDFGDKLVVTHIADNDGVHDLHLMPTDGNVDWNKVASELARTELGRDRILAEPALGGFKKFKGKSADEIRADISGLPIASEPEIVVIEDGKFSSYRPLTYEQKMERLFVKMKNVAKMIDDEIAKS